MYLLDLWREAYCDLVLKWKPQRWAEERGQISSGVGSRSGKALPGAESLHRPAAIPDARRQVCQSAIHPWPHGS